MYSRGFFERDLLEGAVPGFIVYMYLLLCVFDVFIFTFINLQFIIFNFSLETF